MLWQPSIAIFPSRTELARKKIAGTYQQLVEKAATWQAKEIMHIVG